MGGADHYLDEEEIGGGDFDLEYEAEEGEYDEEGDVSDADRQEGRNTFKVPDLDIDIDEEEFASDELRSENESSGDEYVKQGYVSVAPGKKTKKKFKLYNENKDGPFKFEIGMKFSSMEEFRTAVREYDVRERRALHFITNDNDRVQVGCEKGCRFYIWCGKLRDAQAVQIKTLLDDHLCTKPYYNNLISVKFLTEKYGDRIRHNPQWKVKDMMETIREELEVEVPRIKCSRVRKAALQGVFDSLKVHYSRVRDFGHELLKNNPQNRVDIRTSRVSDDDVNKFKRMYICYHALKQGWKLGCRPVLGLDGCFLKTPCGGQLLSAVGRDGNNMMFPVAYAIVESESTDSWKWFIELLGEDLSLGDGHGYTIISDQQKGLDNAIKHYLPRVEHRLCTRHLYANIRKRYKTGAIRKAFWFAACATYPAAHQRIMKGLEKLSKPLSDKLKNLPPSSWSKAFFGTHSVCDNVENNMSESFNSWILNERLVSNYNYVLN
nr:PREDICTED: uncharacterized protein LOC108201329 [Daucus carota subsp. sativus]